MPHGQAVNIMPESLRVLQVCAGFSLELLGGVERYTFDLSRALCKLGVRVSIAGLWLFDTAQEREWMRRLSDNGIRTFAGVRKDDRAPLRNFLGSVTHLRQNLSGCAFDIIHSQQEFGDVAAVLLKRAVHAKALARSVHNDREWRNRPLRRLLLTHLTAPLAFAAECGITQGITEQLNQRPYARLLRRRAGVIHNAIDLSRFDGINVDKQAARQRLGWPADAFIVGSVGRLSEQKGYIDLIQAAALVHRQLPAARFCIVGGGEMHDALQQQIDTLALSDVVVLDGMHSNMNDVYAGMDVYASSSLWEGLPTVLLEAMTAGVPIVATAVDGTTELIRHEQTGWLVPARSPEAMAEAILKMRAADAKLLAQWQQSARDTARQYSIDTAAGQWMQAYRALLGLAGSRDAHDVQA
jgi:glycosyltransferase involved in cell wall biosynthesis